MELRILRSTRLHPIQQCPCLSRLTRTSTFVYSTSRLVSWLVIVFVIISFILVIGECQHSMLAHLDTVTTLSIDTTGFSLVSGSHDGSIRFWDILGSRTCVQEINAHRQKSNEGTLDVQFHPSMPFIASAGADGVVKIYAS